MKSLSIALFGCYQGGNFGDDLMAIIFAREFQSRDIQFKVYGLCSEVVSRFKFKQAHSVDTLLENVDAVVYGGGGAFLSNTNKQLEQDIESLCTICRKRNIPIYMISVGGDGEDASKLCPSRLQLLRQAKYISFRNPEDTILVPKMTGRHKVYSDIVWSTSSRFVFKCKTSSTRPIICIDRALISKRSLKTTVIICILILICKIFLRPYLFKIYTPGYQKFKRKGQADINLSSLENLIFEISQAKLVLTSRLHLGMVAMSYGIPTVQICPLKKAALLFRRLNLQSLMVTNVGSFFRIVKLLLDDSGIVSIKSEFKKVNIKEMACDSHQHVIQLFEELSALRESNFKN